MLHDFGIDSTGDPPIISHKKADELNSVATSCYFLVVFFCSGQMSWQWFLINLNREVRRRHNGVQSGHCIQEWCRFKAEIFSFSYSLILLLHFVLVVLLLTCNPGLLLADHYKSVVHDLTEQIDPPHPRPQWPRDNHQRISFSSSSSLLFFSLRPFSAVNRSSSSSR